MSTPDMVREQLVHLKDSAYAGKVKAVLPDGRIVVEFNQGFVARSLKDLGETLEGTYSPDQLEPVEPK